MLASTAIWSMAQNRRGEARSVAGCPPSESSGANVHVQPMVTTALRHCAVYHGKLGPLTICLNLVTNHSLILTKIVYFLYFSESILLLL